MSELFRSAAYAYIRNFPVEKGKYHLVEATRRFCPPRKVISKVAGGHLMELDLSDHIQSFLYFYGYYEKQLTELIQATLRPGSVMVDVGANVGTFSLLAASLGAISYAFEASPDVCSALRRNIALNGFSNIVVHECAMGDHLGEASFYLFEDTGKTNRGQSALFRRGSGREIRVPMRTLDSTLADLSRLDFLKCDVEGADFLVLRGARELLDRFHPVVAVEASAELAAKLGGTAAEILDVLWEHGYQIERLTRTGTAPVTRDTPPLSNASLIASVAKPQ